MTIWLTEIQAIDPTTGELCTWSGPRLEGITAGDAQLRCQESGQGYCRVVGRLLAEISTKDDGVTPDFENKIDHDTFLQN